MTAVVDASTLLLAAGDAEADPRASIVRAVLPELSDRLELHAPDLLAWEVANVVHRKAPHAFGRTVAERSRTVALLLRPVTLVPSGPSSIERTGEIAETFALTAYDAAYLELAGRDAESILVTEDRALRTAARTRLGTGRAFDVGEVQGAIAAGKV